MGFRGAALCLLLLGLAGGCAAFNAQKHYSAGQKAEQSGDLEAAVASYREAAQTAPKNAKYTGAFEAAKAAAVQKRLDRATELEGSGKWKEALAEWDAASKIDPTNPLLKARAELATLHTRRSEPIEFWEATKKLAAAMPMDKAIQRELLKRRDEAILYYVRLAETYADAGAAGEAYLAFEKARKIDPEHETFGRPLYRMTKAKHLESLGDQKAAAGDQIGAYRDYEAAIALENLPGLQKKLERVKRSAGSSIEQIEQARGYEKLQQWEDAAELYTVIVERKDAPKEVEAAAKIARQNSAELRAKRALELAQKEQPDQALATLELALEHTDPAPVVDGVRKGIEALRQRNPSAADAAFRGAGDPSGLLVRAGLATALAAAKAAYADAEGIAASDPAGAMVRLAKLTAFEKELRNFDATKKALLKKAFSTLLEQAEAKAQAGANAEAADLFGTALELANPPKSIKAPLEAGTTAMKTGDYATAEGMFARVLEQDARSKLAEIGRRIASHSKLAKVRKDAAEAMAVGDAIRAASAYQKIIEVDPSDAAAKQALSDLRPQIIEQSIRKGVELERAGKPGQAFIYFTRARDLEPANGEANSGITRVTSAFEQRESALAWVAPVVRGRELGEACPGAADDLRERLILYLTRSRNLGVQFLQRAPTLAVDANERPAPSAELLTALEHCAVGESTGDVVVTMQFKIAGEVVYDGQARGRFDPSSVPKDELADGINPDKVEDVVLGAGAKEITALVIKHAAKLADWRVIEARARMKANDDEGVARSFATLRMDAEKLKPTERAVLGDLERYILNRFR